MHTREDDDMAGSLPVLVAINRSCKVSSDNLFEAFEARQVANVMSLGSTQSGMKAFLQAATTFDELDYHAGSINHNFSSSVVDNVKFVFSSIPNPGYSLTINTAFFRRASMVLIFGNQENEIREWANSVNRHPSVKADFFKISYQVRDDGAIDPVLRKLENVEAATLISSGTSPIAVEVQQAQMVLDAILLKAFRAHQAAQAELLAPAPRENVEQGKRKGGCSLM